MSMRAIRLSLDEINCNVPLKPQARLDLLLWLTSANNALQMNWHPFLMAIGDTLPPVTDLLSLPPASCIRPADEQPANIWLLIAQEQKCRQRKDYM